MGRTTDRWDWSGEVIANRTSVKMGGVSMVTGKYSRRLQSLPTYPAAEYRRHNQVKASEVDNPFLFPPETTYDIGTGRILNEATRQLDVSDRNFGSYPTYLFTETGVYELAQATAETVHGHVSSPTFMEPPVSGVICQTPYGIAYASRSGVMLLVTAYSTVNISERIWAQRREPRVDFLERREMKGLQDFPYREFLLNPSAMVYDPHAEELRIASDVKPSVLLVYHFPAKEWYMMERRMTGEIVGRNMYPMVRMYRREGITVLAQRWDKGRRSPVVEVAMTTRPLTFGTTYLKNVKRLWLRAWMALVREGSWGVGWSEGGEVYHDVAHHYRGGLHPYQEADRPPRHLRDLDSGLLPRNKARYFCVCLCGRMELPSHIEAVEIEHDYTYVTNDKLR